MYLRLATGGNIWPMGKLFKLTFGLGASFALIDCNYSMQASGGVIRCDSLAVYEGKEPTFSFRGQVYCEPIYEYKAEDGRTIYTDDRVKYRDYSSTTPYEWEWIDAGLSISPGDNPIYHFSRLVGYVETQINCYYDFDKRLIDIETKYVKSDYEGKEDDGPIDNKKALSAFKDGYYDVGYEASGQVVFVYESDIIKPVLESHVYYQVGDSAVVSYTVCTDYSEE